MSKKIYLIAGEASGDMHAGNLMRAILAIDKSVEFKFWGGDRMKEVANNGLIKHIKDLAFMGFAEVVANLRTILNNFKECKKSIEEFQPDALILVDYPGFNLRMAKWAKEKGIPVHYYISPQVWAWKQSRVHKIKRFVDKMYVILPFEKEFYARFNFDVEFVGHPLLDEIELFNGKQDPNLFKDSHNLSDKPIIAILPGSRKQEVSHKLPIMLDAIRNLEGYQVIIAGAPALSASFYSPFLNGEYIVYNETYTLLSNAKAALVTSGTATLETALFKVPEVVCYKGGKMSYMIARMLIKVPYISLVNLIMNREVVKELIQSECNAKNIRRELERVLQDDGREKLMADYNELQIKLGGSGASERVAQSLLKTIR
jgi:lipid-A-disaccharide synthase